MIAKTRLRAFGWHLAASATIGLCSAALVYLLWYPPPLDGAAGVTGIFLLLLGVDVAIGPLITLAVYDVRKKELRRDMVIVCLLQLAALLYGLHAVHVARPVFLVFSVDRFEMVFANDVDDQKLKKARFAQYSSLSESGPELAATRRPDDAAQRSSIALGALMGGDDLAQMPEFYVPYPDQAADAVARLRPLSALSGLNPNRQADVEALVKKYADVAGGVGYLPVRGKVRDISAVLSSRTGDVLAFVDLNPWD